MFLDWFEQCFVEKLKDLRVRHNYNGPSLLILDGAPQHFNASMFKLCELNNIYVMFLPTHSSNQTQPMDLGIFHVHKERIRHTDLESLDDTNFVIVIVSLFHAWEQTATTKNIMGAWKAMGAVFEVKPGSCSIIRFQKLLL